MSQGQSEKGYRFDEKAPRVLKAHPAVSSLAAESTYAYISIKVEQPKQAPASRCV